MHSGLCAAPKLRTESEYDSANVIQCANKSPSRQLLVHDDLHVLTRRSETAFKHISLKSHLTSILRTHYPILSIHNGCSATLTHRSAPQLMCLLPVSPAMLTMYVRCTRSGSGCVCVSAHKLASPCSRWHLAVPKCSSAYPCPVD